MPIPTDTMASTRSDEVRREARSGVRLAVLVYAGIAGLWILLSDKLLFALIDDQQLYERVSLIKGWAFVAVTAAALYLLLNRVTRRTVVVLARENALLAERTRALTLLDAIVSSSSDPVFAKDADGRYLMINPAFCRLLRTRPEQLIGRTDTAVLPADVARRTMDNDRIVMSGGEVVHFEEVLPTTDGERVFLATKGPLRDAGGRVIGLYGVARDITERQHAERLLRESEERLRALFDHSPVGYQSLDARGRFIHVNPTLCALLGYRAEELLGRTFADMVMPDQRADFEASFERFMRTGRVQRELRLQHRNGHEIVVWLAGRIETDARDEFARTHCILSDMTEQAVAVRALAERETLLREIGELAHIGGWALEMPAGRLSVTDEVVRICGSTPRWLVPDAPLGDELDAVDAQRLRIALSSALVDGRTFDVELALRRPDGGQTWIRVLGAPVCTGPVDAPAPTGRVVRLRGTLQDISDRRRMEDELRTHRTRLEEQVQIRTAELAVAKDAAESASRSKSLFLANMSHEMRTPLNAVVGLTHLLARSALDDTQRGQTARIEAAASHLRCIIDDVLDLSRIEAHKLALETTTFRIDMLLEQVRSMMQQRADERGLTLSLHAQGLPALLRGDVTRLRQALLNYVSNAIKFTERGAVGVSATLAGRCGDAVLVRFEVVDTGIGIDPQDMPRLFDIFEQGDATTTRRFGGSGLGLSITRKLARLMGGDAGASSEPGQGSRFWFSALLGVEGEDAGPEAVAGDDNLACLRRDWTGAHVLVVEDEASNREVLQALLEDAALRVTPACDGEEAVERLGAGRYDLVLMDLQLPRMDGLEATRQVRRMAHCATVPVIAVTASALFADRGDFSDAGLDDFLTKPVQPADLYARVLEWLRSGRRPGASMPAVRAEGRASVLIERLIPLLEAADTTAGALAREGAALLHALGDDGRALTRSIAAFDYDEALIRARRLLGA